MWRTTSKSAGWDSNIRLVATACSRPQHSSRCAQNTLKTRSMTPNICKQLATRIVCLAPDLGLTHSWDPFLFSQRLPLRFQQLLKCQRNYALPPRRQRPRKRNFQLFIPLQSSHDARLEQLFIDFRPTHTKSRQPIQQDTDRKRRRRQIASNCRLVLFRLAPSCLWRFRLQLRIRVAWMDDWKDGLMKDL